MAPHLTEGHAMGTRDVATINYTSTHAPAASSKVFTTVPGQP